MPLSGGYDMNKLKKKEYKELKEKMGTSLMGFLNKCIATTDYVSVIVGNSIILDENFSYDIDEVIVSEHSKDRDVVLNLLYLSLCGKANVVFKDEYVNHEEHLIIYIGSSFIDESTENVDSFWFDSLWDTTIVSHGLLTGFSKGNTGSEAIKKAEQLKDSSLEVCCSDKCQPIGPIGVYLKGKTGCVSNVDLWSRIDIDTQKRVWDKRCDYVFSKDQYSLEKWDHTEHIKYDFTIVGVWIKDWAALYPDFVQAAEEISNMFGDVKIFKVRNRH